MGQPFAERRALEGRANRLDHACNPSLSATSDQREDPASQLPSADDCRRGHERGKEGRGEEGDAETQSDSEPSPETQSADEAGEEAARDPCEVVLDPDLRSAIVRRVNRCRKGPPSSPGRERIGVPHRGAADDRAPSRLAGNGGQGGRRWGSALIGF